MCTVAHAFRNVYGTVLPFAVLCHHICTLRAPGVRTAAARTPAQPQAKEGGGAQCVGAKAQAPRAHMVSVESGDVYICVCVRPHTSRRTPGPVY